MEKTCYIIGAGEIFENDFVLLNNRTTNDCIIAADGGFCHLQAHNILPDILIGDLDSVSEDTITKLSDQINIITLNPIKDNTDMDACVCHGMSLGYTNFVLLGASGGRLDHTLANIQLMHRIATLGHSICMYSKENLLQIICNNSVHFPATCHGMISVFSLTDTSLGVCESGLKYTLNNAELSNQVALGVSNEFIGIPSTISVEKGTLLIVSPRF